MALISMLALVPIYEAGSVDDLNDLESVSIAHILEEDDYKLGTAAFVSLGIFSAIIFYVLGKFYVESVRQTKGRKRIHYLQLVTLEIRNLPSNLDPTEYNPRLKELVDENIENNCV
jgi:hypothetical protein